MSKEVVALIVQDGYSYWSKSDLTRSKDAQETALSLRRLLPSFQKPERVFTENSMSSSRQEDLSWTHEIKVVSSMLHVLSLRLLVARLFFLFRAACCAAELPVPTPMGRKDP